MVQMKNIPQFNPADISSEYALLNAIIKDYLAKNLATVQPVQVIKVYEDNSFVDVAPLIEVEDTSGNLLAIGAEDTIYSIPIIQHFGNNCQITIAPGVGDVGFLLASKYDLSIYKKTKEKAAAGSYRQFDWANGVFLPLTFNQAGSGVILRNNQTQIDLQDGQINITGDTLVINCKTAEVNAETSATVNSPAVNLGGEGGLGVARLGDAVEVNVTSGSSAGTWSGTITAASSIVKAK